MIEPAGLQDCKRAEVIERVKQAMLWSELPLKELQRIARAHGLPGRETQTKDGWLSSSG